MFQLIGFAIVLVVVIGGLWLSSGPAVLSALPMELALIGGAGLGTVLIANAPSVARGALGGFVIGLRGSKWGKADYTALHTSLHELMRRARRSGLVAIEADIEEPETSAVFQANPALLRDVGARNLICDSFRLLALDPSTKSHLEGHMEETVQVQLQERHRAVSALHTLADALPALGIVAAVLGIIKTMGVIDQSPAVLGEMIAAALLGTFLGVFLAYGLVGPIASRFGQIVDEEAHYLDQIKLVLGAFAQDIAPRTALEIARAQLPVELRPDPLELDQAVMAAHFSEAARVA